MCRILCKPPANFAAILTGDQCGEEINDHIEAVAAFDVSGKVESGEQRETWHLHKDGCLEEVIDSYAAAGKKNWWDGVGSLVP